MRTSRCGFAREAERFERLLDVRGELGEIRSGLDAAPEHARLEFVREKAETAKMHRDGLRGANRRERGADSGEFFADPSRLEISA